MSTLLKSKLVAIKKEHICFGCGRKFPKGTFLKYQVFADCGILAIYMCPVCEEVIDNDRQYYAEDDSIGFAELRYGDIELWERMRFKVEGEKDLSLNEKEERK